MGVARRQVVAGAVESRRQVVAGAAESHLREVVVAVESRRQEAEAVVELRHRVEAAVGEPRQEAAVVVAAPHPAVAEVEGVGDVAPNRAPSRFTGLKVRVCTAYWQGLRAQRRARRVAAHASGSGACDRLSRRATRAAAACVVLLEGTDRPRPIPGTPRAGARWRAVSGVLGAPPPTRYPQTRCSLHEDSMPSVVVTTPPAPVPLPTADLRMQFLVRLRTWAYAVELVFIAGAALVFPDAFSPVAPLVLAAVGLLSNLAWQKRTEGRAVTRAALRWPIALDIVLLTGVLWTTGGAANPFSALYLVHVTLASVLLDRRDAWIVLLAAALGYGSLFAPDVAAFVRGPASAPVDHAAPVEHAGHAMHGAHAAHGASSPSSSHSSSAHSSSSHSSSGGHGAGMHHMGLHLQGMWVAFVLAGGLITAFVGALRRALDAQADAERRVAELETKNGHLAALATLAGGAAHEFATPLSSIALVAKETARSMDKRRDAGHDVPAAWSEDIALIRGEVTRCHGILQRMSADAGEALGEHLETRPLAALVRAAASELPHAPGLSLRGLDETAAVHVPPQSVQMALINVVKNALDAHKSTVELTLTADQDWVRLSVRDDGPGMPEAVLKRVGEPFFTTKAPGAGMGLGLFLVRSVLDRVSARLSLTSAVGVGTTAVLEFPRADAHEARADAPKTRADAQHTGGPA